MEVVPESTDNPRFRSGAQWILSVVLLFHAHGRVSSQVMMVADVVCDSIQREHGDLLDPALPNQNKNGDPSAVEKEWGKGAHRKVELGGKETWSVADCTMEDLWHCN